MWKVFLAVLLPLLSMRAAFAGSESAPDWAMQAHARPLPPYGDDVSSVTVFDESEAALELDGTLHRTLRYAVRVLNVEGRTETVAVVPYLKGKTKIKELRAWLISPDGSVKAYGKESVVDANIKESFELYDEYRERMIQARNAPAGSTFAWTASYDDSLLTLEDVWHFQSRQPVLLSRYSVTVPTGWKAAGIVFNTASIQPIVSGTTYTWEAKELGLIKREPCSPAFSSVAPWLGVSFVPGSGDSNPKAVGTWKDVSGFQTALASKQADMNAAMAAKIQELTASSSTQFAKIQALGNYVQHIKYVEIATNLARGGGYIPHAASEVFAKQYGDCKDKANLMRALLKQAGLDSYLVAIFSGDRNYVHPDWASPGQFNHMIIAIKVPDAIADAAVLVHPVLGRLLFFDPTDAFTPVGDLPEDEQGSYALLIAGANGDLVRAPVAPPETNRMSMEITGTLGASGALQANVSLETRGDAASHLRSLYGYMKQSDVQSVLERWVTEGTRQMTVNHLESNDNFDVDQFGLKMNVSSPIYAQMMQQRMLVFRPSIVPRLFSKFEMQADARIHPVVLSSECFHRQVHLKLPAGFTVDEMPDAAHFATEFGKFTSSYKLDGDDLLFTEDLDVNAATLPASSYGDVKSFFQHVAGAEQAPMLLMRN